MIFVTVGTHHFNDLVRIIDEACAAGRLREEVVIQIGKGSYTPTRCGFFRQAPCLDPYYDRARLVVGHGGTGTTLEVLERGLPLISVANPMMADNHQWEFLEALERLGHVRFCRDVRTVVDMIAAVPLGEPRSRLIRSSGVSEAIEGFAPRPESWMRRFRSLLRFFIPPMAALHPSPAATTEGPPPAARSSDHVNPERRTDWVASPNGDVAAQL